MCRGTITEVIGSGTPLGQSATQVVKVGGRKLGVARDVRRTVVLALVSLVHRRSVGPAPPNSSEKRRPTTGEVKVAEKLPRGSRPVPLRSSCSVLFFSRVASISSTLAVWYGAASFAFPARSTPRESGAARRKRLSLRIVEILRSRIRRDDRATGHHLPSRTSDARGRRLLIII